jgi:hypothetical protein
MQLHYDVYARGRAPDLAQAAPDELRPLLVMHTAFEGVDDYIWRCTVPTFDKLPALRAWLRAQPSLAISELGGRAYSEKDGLSADLVRFTAGNWDEVKLLSPPVVYQDTCMVCGAQPRRLVDHPSATLALPRRQRPALFWCSAATVTVMSASLVENLKVSEMAAGLQTFPIEIKNDPSAAYVGVFAGVDLGWPAAPYGTGQPICDRCGSTFPRYSFYHIYPRPKEPAHWMWSRLHGPPTIFMTRQLLRFLIDGGVFSDKIARRRHFVAQGWYPDELAQAFLPEGYHDR